MLRIAIVGVGWAGTRQAEAIRELEAARGGDCPVSLAALVDNDPDHLSATAARLGVATTYTRLEDALADSEIDAVSICAPHALHAPQALAAAAARKHVLVEKPMALTVAEATTMIDAARASGVALYVAESEVYSPQSRRLREVVTSGRYVGELTCATYAAGFRAPRFGYEGRRGWLTRPEQGGTGTWMLQGIHSVAQLRYVLGEIATVYVHEHKAASFERRDLEGTMTGLLILESGIPVTIIQTCETRVPTDLGGYVLHGDRGSLHARRDSCLVYGEEAGPDQPLRLAYPADELSEYAREIEAFADHVAGRAVGPTTGEAERRSLAVVEAGYDSARTGRPIDLRERYPGIW